MAFTETSFWPLPDVPSFGAVSCSLPVHHMHGAEYPSLLHVAAPTSQACAQHPGLSPSIVLWPRRTQLLYVWVPVPIAQDP